MLDENIFRGRVAAGAGAADAGGTAAAISVAAGTATPVPSRGPLMEAVIRPPSPPFEWRVHEMPVQATDAGCVQRECRRASRRLTSSKP